MPAEEGARSRTRIVLGRVRQSDVSTRTILPTPRSPEFDPYLRIAESIGTSRKDPVLHTHLDEEIAMVVLEGAVDHLVSDGHRSMLDQGTVLVATAGQELRHGFRVGAGRTARWLSVVTRLGGAASASSIAIGILPEGTGAPGPEGAIVRELVGANAAVPSPAHSVLKEVRFVNPGTIFLSLGRGRRGFAYALKGEGRVQDQPISAGQAALLEPQAGIALRGEPGFWTIFGSAPLSAPAVPAGGPLPAPAPPAGPPGPGPTDGA
jgi:quercetin 2,3-dioxygenase